MMKVVSVLNFKAALVLLKYNKNTKVKNDNFNESLLFKKKNI